MTALASLSQGAVLKRYAAWPERRVDAIREVAAVYAAAQQLMADAASVTQVRFSSAVGLVHVLSNQARGLHA